jgi:alpha-tubulin suppressor-like RCC1 family protein
VPIASGYDHSVAVASDGTVWSWGSNSFLQLGDGAPPVFAAPIQISGLSDVVAVSADDAHSLALKKDGTVWTWGNKLRGQPVKIRDLTGVVAIVAGGPDLALKRDGTVWAWGDNDKGQLGGGICKVPGQVCGLPPVLLGPGLDAVVNAASFRPGPGHPVTLCRCSAGSLARPTA